jgi:RHS repeat-associated protein
MQPTLEHNHARYDELNRLSTMSSPADASGCTGLSWTYDAWANRTNQTTSSGACTESHPTIGANNQFTGAPYTYDAAGNMTADGNHTYTYDAENRLTTVDGGATATYVYDAEGQRVLKTTGGVTTAYLYDPAGNVIAETNGGDTLNIGYAYAGSQLVAEYEGGTTLFVHKDHLGSTRVITAMNGTVSDSMDYLPYGEQIAGGSTTTHKFTGKERDAETGLDNFDARCYSSNLGRFVSADWSAIPVAVPYARLDNPQTLNLYSYVLNNPVALVDDNGHDIKYADGLKNAQLVKDTVQAILNDPQTSASLSGYVGPDNPDLIIKSGDLSGKDTVTRNPADGTVTTTTVQGETDASNLQQTTYTENGVTSAPQVSGSATITIDNRTSKSDTVGVMVHETTHAGEARANPAQSARDAATERSLPHDQRPQEQRANAAQKAHTNQIKKAVKKIEKDRQNGQGQS